MVDWLVRWLVVHIAREVDIVPRSCCSCVCVLVVRARQR